MVRLLLIAVFLPLCLSAYYNPPSDVPLPQNPMDFQSGKLTLSQNINQGSVLVLSDGTYWEVKPEDRTISSLWLFPIAVELGQSGDSLYPVSIKNRHTGSVISVKKIKPMQ